MPARHYLISGRVQGVWYRASCVAQAQSLRLSGWVRNLRDGRVEAVAQGDEQQLAALERWLAEGPPLARVSEVAAEDWQAEVGPGFVAREDG